MTAVRVTSLPVCGVTEELRPPEGERFWGDYSPRRFGWIVEVREVFPEPIPARGALGLWDWERPA